MKMVWDYGVKERFDRSCVAICVFGYFAIGAPVHFCVIPVDNESLANYAASGVDVREIG